MRRWQDQRRRSVLSGSVRTSESKVSRNNEATCSEAGPNPGSIFASPCERTRISRASNLSDFSYRSPPDCVLARGVPDGTCADTEGRKAWCLIVRAETFLRSGKIGT